MFITCLRLLHLHFVLPRIWRDREEKREREGKIAEGEKREGWQREREGEIIERQGEGKIAEGEGGKGKRKGRGKDSR